MALVGNSLMGLSWQQSDSPNPLSLPPQEAARCDSRVRRRLLLSGDSREMKLDLEVQNQNVFMILVILAHLLENM